MRYLQRWTIWGIFLIDNPNLIIFLDLSLFEVYFDTDADGWSWLRTLLIIINKRLVLVSLLSP